MLKAIKIDHDKLNRHLDNRMKIKEKTVCDPYIILSLKINEITAGWVTLLHVTHP